MFENIAVGELTLVPKKWKKFLTACFGTAIFVELEVL